MKFFEKYSPGSRKLRPELFWEYNADAIVPEKAKRLIVTRVIQIGTLDDFYAAFDNLGGIESFKEVAQKEVTGLDKRDLNFICQAFGLKKEETICYKKILSRQKHLNFSAH